MIDLAADLGIGSVTFLQMLPSARAPHWPAPNSSPTSSLYHRGRTHHPETVALRLRSGRISWAHVPAWLAEAAVVIVPSLRESFRLVALEAMSVGTPVICFDIDHLASLVGTGPEAGGVVVARAHGEHALWKAAEKVLGDPVGYRHLSRAAYYRSRDFRPTTVAEFFVKAVR